MYIYVTAFLDVHKFNCPEKLRRSCVCADLRVQRLYHFSCLLFIGCCDVSWRNSSTGFNQEDNDKEDIQYLLSDHSTRRKEPSWWCGHFWHWNRSRLYCSRDLSKNQLSLQTFHMYEWVVVDIGQTMYNICYVYSLSVTILHYIPT